MNNINEMNNNQSAGDSTVRKLNIIKMISGALTVVIGVMILAGYILGNYFIFNLGKDYIPMADETALLFIIIGIVLLLIDKSRTNSKLHYLILALSIFVGLIGILASIDVMTNYTYNFSEILGGNHNLISNMLIGKMSVITAIIFILFSISLILLIYKNEKISAAISSLIVFIGYILINGYWFGVPYLYGGTFIPVALPTAIVMIISSLGMLTAAGYDNPPLKYFFGESTQARLMRSFIPIIFFYNLFQDSILTLGKENINSYFALQNSIVDILALILTAFIISIVSRTIGKSIDNYIAERKAAEEAAKKSEEKLLITLNSIGDGVITTDKNGFVTNMNPIAENMCGYKESEAKGKQLSEIFNIINADTREKVTNPVGLVLESGALVGLANHTVLVSKDGSEYQIADSAAPIKDDFGTISGVVLVFSDVTEQYLAEQRIRESEVKYRSLIEQMQEGLLVVDNNDIIQFVNSRLCEMLGYEEVELVGKVGYEILVNESDRLKIIEKNLERQKGIPERYELKMVSKSGEEIIMFMNASPAYDKNGKIVGSLSTCIDITERKRAEEEIIMLAHSLRSINECVSITDMEDNIQFVNESFLKTYGYDENELVGKHINIVRSQNNPPELVKEILPAALNGGWSGELWNKRKDGSEFPIYLSTTIIKDKDGKLVWLIGVATDITERKLAEEKLLESEEKYRNIFENAREGIFQTNINGTYISVNPALAKMYGFESPEELINTRHDISKDSYFDAKERDKYLKMIEKDGFVEGYEYEVKHKYGKKLWFYEDSRAVKDENGRIQYFEGFVIDISELKRAEGVLLENEERLQTIIETVPDIIYMLDLNGNLVKWNSRAERVTGFSPEELMNKPALDLFPEEDRTGVSESIWKVFETGFSEVEAHLLRKDGTRLPYHFAGAPLKDTQGNVKGLAGVGRDITERKLAEEKLLESEEKYRNIFKNAREGIFQTNINGTYISVNPALAKMLGFDSPEELINTIHDISKDSYYDPMERDKFLRMMEEKGFVKGYEYEVKHKDGTKIWFYEDSRAVKDENGRIQYFEGFVLDITERKRAEEALHDSENRYRSVIENASEGIIIYDMATRRVLNSNPAYQKLLGYTAAEMCELTIYDIVIPNYHGVDFMIDRIKTEKDVWIGERQHKRKDGSKVDVEASSSLNIYRGKEVFSVIVRDITERKRAEEKLQYHQKLLQEMGRVAKIGGWEFEVATGKGTWTEETAIIHDLDPKDETSMEHGLSFYTDKSRSKVVDAIKEAIEFGKSYNLELELITGKNVHKWVQTIGHPQIANGKVINLRGSFQDITERKLAEQEIKQKNEELLLLNASKDKFFSIIAHDLKSPLSGLLGLSSLMVENINAFSKEDLIEFSKRLYETSDNLYKMIENLLEWARLQKGLITCSFESFNLNTLVKNNVEIIAERANQKQISIENNLPVSLNVLADLNMTDTILRNLISNAVKFTHRGGNVEIGTTLQPSEGLKPSEGYIEIFVKDSGVGISESNIDMLFKIDGKLQSSGTENEPSTGLGLILCKEFIEMQGGNIRVESVVGKGSTFYFTLPI